jgi:hypothetical protein
MSNLVFYLMQNCARRQLYKTDLSASVLQRRVDIYVELEAIS